MRELEDDAAELRRLAALAQRPTVAARLLALADEVWVRFGWDGRAGRDGDTPRLIGGGWRAQWRARGRQGGRRFYPVRAHFGRRRCAAVFGSPPPRPPGTRPPQRVVSPFWALPRSWLGVAWGAVCARGRGERDRALFFRRKASVFFSRVCPLSCLITTRSPPPPPPPLPYEPLASHSWVQDDARVSVYVPLRGVTTASIDARFSVDAVEVRAHGVGGRNHVFSVPRTARAILPGACVATASRTKKNMLVSLAKAVPGERWPTLDAAGLSGPPFLAPGAPPPGGHGLGGGSGLPPPPRPGGA